MLLQLNFATVLITVVTSQEYSNQQNDEPKENKEHRPPVEYAGTPNSEFPQQNEIQPLVDLKQFYTGQPYSSELYRWTPLDPQYQADETLPRLQPQIVLYSPGGQGQPILINPGNPPGNFLFPQGPGPNVIIRNNPQSPQGPVFPVAGYPKPAHIPPIEKDAEEIPTNLGKIPPLPSEAKPVTKTRNKPEKLETFNDPNQPDQNVKLNKDQFPQGTPKPVNLQPGQRFFVLNGDHVFSYPVEAQPQVQNDLPALRYTNVQPFPQNPPKFLQTFGQEPSQILQRGQESTLPVPVPHLLQRNSFINPQQLELQVHQSQSEPNQVENEDAIKGAPQYFRAGFPVNLPELLQYSQSYPVRQLGTATSPLNQNFQEAEGVEGINLKDEVIQPQVVGQFRFTPSALPGLFPFKDDIENDAIVVDASFDARNNLNGRGGSLKAEENESTTPKQDLAEKESEPSMAQAGPQATAIAGLGGVAGSSPRATAIVGKGGLAVSSPQATAVAGTKDEDKKKRPVRKNT